MRDGVALRRLARLARVVGAFAAASAASTTTSGQTPERLLDHRGTLMPGQLLHRVTPAPTHSCELPAARDEHHSLYQCDRCGQIYVSDYDPTPAIYADGGPPIIWNPISARWARRLLRRRQAAHHLGHAERDAQLEAQRLERYQRDTTERLGWAERLARITATAGRHLGNESERGSDGADRNRAPITDDADEITDGVGESIHD